MTYRRTRSNDDGITLVELILYVVIGTLFLAIVSMIFINGWASQKSTSDRDIATGRATIVTASLQQAIRNAQEVYAPNPDVLIAMVSTSDVASPTCRAWKFEDGTIKSTTSHTVIDPGTSANWSVLAQGVTQTDSGPVFTALPGAAPKIEVVYAFTVSEGTSFVPVTGGAVAQGKVRGVTGGDGTCWNE